MKAPPGKFVQIELDTNDCLYALTEDGRVFRYDLHPTRGDVVWMEIVGPVVPSEQ